MRIRANLTSYNMEKKPLFAVIFNTNNVHESDRDYIVDEIHYITKEWDHSEIEVERLQKADHEKDVPIDAATFFSINLNSEELTEKYTKIVTSRYTDWWA